MTCVCMYSLTVCICMCVCVSILKVFHAGTTGVVRMDGCFSRDFIVENGVRQGDVLAPVLFNLFLDALVSIVESHFSGSGVSIVFSTEESKLVGSRRKMVKELLLSDLEYADDMVVMCDSMDVLEEGVRFTDSIFRRMGMIIKARKSCIFGAGPRSVLKCQLRDIQLSSQEVIEVAEKFQYLGSIVDSSGSLEAEISARINKAAKSFGSLKSVLWDRKEIGVNIKIQLFKAVVVSSLLYGCEAWAITASQVQRIQTFVMGCLRVILGISKLDKRRNVEIREKAHVDRVEVLMLKRRLKWLGHVVRMNESRIPRCLLVSKMAGGKRAVGKQKLRWCDVVMSDLKRCEMLDEWFGMALDRKMWRGMICACGDELNEELEAMEKSKKDDAKLRRGNEASFQVGVGDIWRCEASGCGFVARSKAGLVNHKRQRHLAIYQQDQHCPLCGGVFKRQGLHSHVRFCQKK